MGTSFGNDVGPECRANDEVFQRHRKLYFADIVVLLHNHDRPLLGILCQHKVLIGIINDGLIGGIKEGDLSAQSISRGIADFLLNAAQRSGF